MGPGSSEREKMIRRKLKTFFMNRQKNKAILELLHHEELTLIERFLSTKEREQQQYLATQLMERTLYNIDPEFRVFLRLFEVESQKLASMEKGITYMSEGYRGHYIHSVYNYLLGFFLFQEEYLGEEFLKCLNLDYFDGHYSQKPMYDAYRVPRGDEKKEFQIRWALTTFFHDTAYLPEVNLKVMEEEGKRLTGIEKPFSLGINDMQSFLTIHTMSEIETRVRMSFAPDYLFMEDSLEILAYRLVNRLDRFSKDLIYQSLKARIIDTLKAGRFDHGLMGAIFLLQKFYSEIHSFFIKDEKNWLPHLQKFSINRNIIRFTDAMTAVSLHNIRYFKTGIFKEEFELKVRNHKLPLLFLLILCDELQRWDRQLSPPEEQTPLNNVRHWRENRLDKSMFSEHFNNLYREYASVEKPVKKEEKKLVFYVPFWQEKEEKNDNVKYKKFFIFEKVKCDQCDQDLKVLKEKKLKKTKCFYKCAFIIKFERKPLSYFEEMLENKSKPLNESKIDKKIYKQMEKDAWKIFEKNNMTLGKFIELAFGLKKFLSNICLNSREKNKNNKTVRGLETLTDVVLPALKLLRKGQDILSPFMRPYHFHDIVGDKPENSNQKSHPKPTAGSNKNYCTLLLHYPGQEVDEIETVIKDRIVKKLCEGEEKEMALKYPDAPETALNRIINEIYIHKIEEYIYDIQREKYVVIELTWRRKWPKIKKLMKVKKKTSCCPIPLR